MLYGLAAAAGPSRLRAVVIRCGAWIGIGEGDLDRAEAWFDRRSRTAVLVCRCVPLVRSLISVPAGFRRMPLGVCTLYTVAGSLVWNAVIVTTGHLLAGQWERVLVVTEPFPTIALVLISGLVVSLVVRSVRRNAAHRTRSPDAPA